LDLKRNFDLMEGILSRSPSVATGSPPLSDVIVADWADSRTLDIFGSASAGPISVRSAFGSCAMWK
jgi:hypothetical protein